MVVVRGRGLERMAERECVVISGLAQQVPETSEREGRTGVCVPNDEERERGRARGEEGA